MKQDIKKLKYLYQFNGLYVYKFNCYQPHIKITTNNNKAVLTNINTGLIIKGISKIKSYLLNYEYEIEL